MPITLNHSNISVQYSSDKSYIIETVKSDLYFRDSRIGISSNLTAEPIVIAPTFTETIRTFAHSGGTEAQTTHTITIEQNTICDILIVGGGGSGDREVGGGGGGGAVLYATNITIPAGSYTLKVGKGGENGNGGNSEAFGATCLGGGSTDYVAWGTANNGKAGGSGSGASAGGSTVTGGTVGTSTKGALLNSGTLYNGNVGGNALPQVIGTWQAGGGGGGGAETAGLNSTQTLYNTRSSWIAGGRPSSGGNGVQINITGTTYYWGAGGGGAGHYGSHAGDGGLGGGGGGGGSLDGGSIAGLAGTGGLNSGEGGLGGTGTQKGGNGAPNTGSGGGGGGYGANGTYNGGNGGSGIVIIKFKSIVGAGIPEGNPITHKTLNFAFNNDNLVAWYRFNNNYIDSSGYGNHLTNVGTVIQSTQVIEGQAVEFDSIDYLEFPTTINPYNIWNGKGITFSCWVRFTVNELWSTLINFQTSVSNNTGIGLWIRTTPIGPTEAIYLRVNSTIFQYGDANTPLIANLNVWRHLVLCVGISGKMDVYLDNVRINGTETATIPNLDYNARYINRSGNVGTWDGQMDDFRIYNRALSATDVSLLYNKTYQQPNNTYTLNFPVPTIADINNNSNIVLRGAYDIALSTANASIIPKANQYIPKPTTFSTSNISISYHLLNPILDPIGAQWTYSSNNTNVYHMGSVGIGTTIPEYQLDVRGAIYSSIGGITQTGLTTWSITSDRRIKDNITRASYDKCLENVKNIELYNFTFKNNCVNTNDKHQLGFIAQEVQQVYPKAVEVGKIILNTNEAIDDILTLNTTQIDYTLYGAVKNLIEKIEDIDNDLENIEMAVVEPLGETAPHAGN